MAFIEKGQEIDIKQIKSATILSDQALKKKHQRDQELAAIIRGEDQRLSDPAHLIMKRRYWSTLAGWPTSSRK